MAQENERAVDVVSAFYSAAAAGDMDGMFAHIGDDLEIHEPPFLPYGRSYYGREGFMEVQAAAMALLDVSTLKIEYVFGGGDRAAAVVGFALTNGKRTTVIEEWQVRDGKIRWGRVFWFNPEALG